MVDPGTAIGGGAAILASKDLLGRLLGPTADYVGGEVKQFVAKANVNVGEIFSRAASKLGDRMNRDGAVPPRVVRYVLDEGRFCEDAIAREYYAGLLASARTEDQLDDRAVAYLGVIRQLSVWELRLHFAFYWALARVYAGSEKNLGLSTDLQELGLGFPFQALVGPLRLEGSEEDWYPRFVHAAVGLARHDLLGKYAYGFGDHISKFIPEFEVDGLVAAPTLFGAELFLWASGVGPVSGHKFFEQDVADVPEGIPTPELASVARVSSAHLV